MSGNSISPAACAYACDCSISLHANGMSGSGHQARFWPQAGQLFTGYILKATDARTRTH